MEETNLPEHTAAFSLLSPFSTRFILEIDKDEGKVSPRRGLRRALLKNTLHPSFPGVPCLPSSVAFVYVRAVS